MKHLIISLLLLGGFTALSTMEASAFVCARGVYRAGCVGARGGAVVVRHPVVVRGAYVGRRIYR
jgi:hypothetical protein